MGYFKQLEIANQVEVGDRLPAPKPAREHVAWLSEETRADRKLKQRLARKQRRAENIDTAILLSVVMFIGIMGIWGWLR
jgi:hypothetical protein